MGLQALTAAYVQRLEQATRLGRAGVFLVGEDGTLECLPPSSSLCFELRTLDDLSAETRGALESMRAASIDLTDPGVSDTARERGRAEDVRQLVVLPMAVGESLVGFTLLYVGCDSPRLSPRSVMVAAALASEAAVAFDNARRRAFEAEQERMAEALTDIDALLTAPLEPEVMLDSVLSMACESVGCDSACLLLRDGTAWRLAHTIGVPEGCVERCHPEQVADLVAEAFAHDDLVRFDGTGAGSLDARFRGCGVLSAVAAPLVVRGNVIGIAIFESRTEGRDFTGSQERFVRKLAATLSLGVESARLLAAEAEARRLATEELESTENLLAAADALASLDRDEVLDTLAESVLRVTACDSAMVMSYDAEHGELLLKGAAAGQPVAHGHRVPVADLSPRFREVISSPRTTLLDLRRVGIPEIDAGHMRNRIHDALFVPLTVIDRLVGMIAVADTGCSHEFTGREVELLEGLASQAAVALENVRLYEAAQEAASLGETLDGIIAEINGSTDFDETRGRIVKQAAEAVGAESAAIGLLETGEWRVVHPYGQPKGGGSSLTPAEMAAALDALDRKQTVVLADPKMTLRQGRRKGGTDAVARGAIVVPLAKGDEVFGALFLEHAGHGAFSTAQVDFATKLGAHVSLAQANHLSRQRERLSARLSEGLNRVNEILLSVLDVDTMLGKIVAEVSVAIGADRALLAVPAHAGDWVVRALHGLPAELEGARLEPRYARRMTLTARTRRPQLEEDPSADQRMDARFAKQADIASCILMPLVVGDDVLGILNFGYSERRLFGADDLRFVWRLSTAMSLALGNARIHEEQREIARLNAALAEIDRTIHSTMESDEIVRRALSAGAEAIGAVTGSISTFEDELARIDFAHGFDPESRDEPMWVAGQDPLGVRTLSTGESIAVEDAYDDPRLDAGLMRRLPIRSFVIAPLVTKGEVTGALRYGFGAEEHHFSRGQRDFVTKLALSVSLALENAQAYASEHRVAQTLQEALLALPVEVPGVEIAHTYHSASSTARVGGDFYDIFELQHGLLGLVVGDVSGKGLDAAVLTALVKNTIRAHAVVPGTTPAEVMRRVNLVLLKESRTETFVTVFFGILDRRDGRLVYCGAGHPSSLVVRPDGTAVDLPANSPITGAFEAAPFADSEAHLSVDDMLFLYTDGLTESRRAGEMYGEQRLFVQLAHARDTDPAEAIDRVIGDVRAFTGGGLSDDVAVLAIKRLPLPATSPIQQKLPLFEAARVRGGQHVPARR